MDRIQVGTLITELEGTLCLLNELLTELRMVDSNEQDMDRVNELVQALSTRSSLVELPKVLLNVYTEITAALGGIRLSREAIQSHAIDRLRDTHARLDKVTSETESATNLILDGLDRSLAVIDRIAVANGNGGEPSEKDKLVQEAVDTLRNEVMELFNHLQFQDITAQQLRGAIGLLTDVETRLEALATVFDPSSLGQRALEDLTAEADHNADASMADREARQALADETVKEAQASLTC
jgi:chemotaxis regulatin CheY-phosphate phosphatase CheZ